MTNHQLITDALAEVRKAEKLLLEIDKRNKVEIRDSIKLSGHLIKANRISFLLQSKSFSELVNCNKQKI